MTDGTLSRTEELHKQALAAAKTCNPQLSIAPKNTCLIHPNQGGSVYATLIGDAQSPAVSLTSAINHISVVFTANTVTAHKQSDAGNMVKISQTASDPCLTKKYIFKNAKEASVTHQDYVPGKTDALFTAASQFLKTASQNASAAPTMTFFKNELTSAERELFSSGSLRDGSKSNARSAL